MNPIRGLNELGQSVWLDYIDHSILISGELRRMAEDEGLTGLTSNPTIFQKSIAASDAFDDLMRDAAPSASNAGVFEQLAVREVTLACDVFRPVYDRTEGRDGFVSIEVSPGVARDAEASLDEARRLWKRVARPNAFVKIPGTREGLSAIERGLAEGINVNITLLFAVERYREVVEAYFRALEQRAREGQPLDRVASVASFFVSRVDTKVDKALDAMKDDRAARARAERGHAAIANAKVAFAAYRELFTGERWEALAARGARPQRVLWASTSTKDPAYPDLYYAEALAGPDTIDTMTKETFAAYRDHGRPEARVASGLAEARGHIAALAALGIDLRRVTTELEDEGVASFAASYDKAVASIGDKRRRFRATG